MPWFFFAAAFQSLVPILTLLSIPTENGISIARLALLAILFLFLITGIYLGFRASKDSSSLNLFLTRTSSILATTLLSLTGGLILFLLRYLNPEQLLPYYERLSPLLWYVFFIGFELVIFSLLLKYGFHPQVLSKQNFIPALVAFCILFSIFLFITITKIGVTPDTAYWGEPGVPIQLWHFVIAILLSFVILLSAFHSLFTDYYAQITNYLLPIIIYITACVIWLSVPLQTLASSYYAPIFQPTNIPLPYSDAGFYDYNAQSLLIGTGYLGEIPPRPLYITFLAFLHLLFNQNYPAIISAQACILALFPVALFFLGKKLHSPAVGVLVAFFAIFREYTNLVVASNTRVINSKIFTTDFPTALAIATMCLIVIWWLERRDLKSTLMAGGSFGVFLLFRTQSTIILPVLFLLILFVFQFKWNRWIKTGIIFAVAMILTVLPWLTHNYTISGKFSFDDPKQVAVIYSQYSFADNLDLTQFNPETDSVGKRIISFTLENPAYVATFITAHILNTEIGGLLSLPLIKPFNGIFEPVNLYWITWKDSLEWYNIALLLVYLGIIAIGLGTAWRKMKWLGLIPLAFNLGYVLSNGIARFSSWRYNLPVDWVIYFYFAIGLIELFSILISLFGKKITKSENLHLEQKDISIKEFRPQYIFIVLFFMLIGSSPWLAKEIAPTRYIAPQNELVAKLESAGLDKSQIEAFISQPNAVLLEGRLLYPRMLWGGEGIRAANPWPAFAEQDFPRLGFIVINNLRYDVIFPTKELLNFPQGADVIVLACQVDNLYYARIAQFDNQTFQSAPLTEPCP